MAGGPRTGKSTLAGALGLPVLSTDVLIVSYDWSQASEQVATWFDLTGPWVIEGVAAGRALRKWIKANLEGKPCDHILYLTHAYEQLTPGQATMAKGCATVWREILPELLKRGVTIHDTAESLLSTF